MGWLLQENQKKFAKNLQSCLKMSHENNRSASSSESSSLKYEISFSSIPKKHEETLIGGTTIVNTGLNFISHFRLYQRRTGTEGSRPSDERDYRPPWGTPRSERQGFLAVRGWKIFRCCRKLWKIVLYFGAYTLYGPIRMFVSCYRSYLVVGPSFEMHRLQHRVLTKIILVNYFIINHVCQSCGTHIGQFVFLRCRTVYTCR